MKITWQSWLIAVPAATLTFLAQRGWGSWAGALVFVAVLVWIITRRPSPARRWRQESKIQAHRQIPTTGRPRPTVSHQEAA